jgi:ATP-binding cassette subfamily C protein CydCD
LSSVIAADRILVLDQGRVVESGRHDALIARDGPYRRLMGAQASGAYDDTAVIDALDAREAHGAAVSEGSTASVGTDEMPVRIRDIDVDAANVGWRDDCRVPFHPAMGWQLRYHGMRSGV